MAIANVVENGTFEGVGNWRFHGISSISEGAGRNGSRGIHFPNTPSGSEQFISQTVDLVCGSKYTLSCWTKSQGPTMILYANLRYRKMNGQVGWAYFGALDYSGNDTWRQVSADVVMPADANGSSAEITVNAGGAANNTAAIWVDDVTLVGDISAKLDPVRPAYPTQPVRLSKGWVQVTSDGAQEDLLVKTTADAVHMDDTLSSTVAHALVANTSVDAYTHTYNASARVHHFNGVGMVGWARVTAPFTHGDTIFVNGAAVNVFASEHDPKLTSFKPGRTVVFTRTSSGGIDFQSCGERTQMRDCELYGVRIEKGNPNPYTRCTYMYDAVGRTPARMVFGSSGHHFSYGDWGDVGFVRDNRPVMLYSNGKVAYELDPSNLALKKDGGASDIANTAFDGNAMSEMPRWWLKQYEDEDYQYILVSDVQYDDDFHAYAFTHADLSPANYLYLPIYRGSYSNGKLRSLSGQFLMYGEYADREITRAEANGSCWGTRSWAQVDYVNALLTLISCSTDHQRVFGRGRCQFTASTGLVTGTLNTGGQFFGYNDDPTARVKVFWCEDWWGNMRDRIAGLVIKDGEIHAKMTPPYNLSGDGYSNTGIFPATNSPYGNAGIITKMHFCELGKIPSEVGGDDESKSYWADWFQWRTDGIGYAYVGGDDIMDTIQPPYSTPGTFALDLESSPNTASYSNASLSALR